MKFKTIVLFSLPLIALSAGGPAQAHPWGPGCMHGPPGGAYGHRREDPERHLMRRFEHLDLKPGQRTAIHAAFEKARPQFRKLFHEMRANRRALGGMLASAKIDPVRIRALARAQGRLVADLIGARTELRIRIASILTPEQRRKLEELRRDCRWKGAAPTGDTPPMRRDAPPSPRPMVP